jgi:hypothetical protein
MLCFICAWTSFSVAFSTESIINLRWIQLVGPDPILTEPLGTEAAR